MNALIDTCVIMDFLQDVFHALSSDTSDFEDTIMIETGNRCRMGCIITRNIKDFSKSSLSVLTPYQFLQMMNK